MAYYSLIERNWYDDLVHGRIGRWLKDFFDYKKPVEDGESQEYIRWN